MIKIKATGVQCIHCGDTIYSRAHYDMRYCTCRKTFIDGGPHINNDPECGYSRRTVESIAKELTLFELDFDNEKNAIKNARFILYQDWNHSEDKYGLIKKGGE